MQRKLGPKGRKAVSDALTLLSDPWKHGSLDEACSAAMEKVLPGRVTMIYDWSADHRLNIRATTDPTLHDLARHQRVSTRLFRSRAYALRAPEPEPQHVLSLADLYQERPADAERFRDSLLNPWGFDDQARFVVYRDSRFSAWCGALGRKCDPRFCVEETLRLEAIRSELHRLLLFASDLQPATMGTAVLPELLEASAAPALIVSGEGLVLYANARARSFDALLPRETLKAIISQSHTPLEVESQSGFRALRFDLGGRSAFIVLSSDSARGAPATAALGELSDALLRVARPLLDGLSAKQIADRTGLSVASVYTYIRDVYRHYRVSGRSEFMRRFGVIP